MPAKKRKTAKVNRQSKAQTVSAEEKGKAIATVESTLADNTQPFPVPQCTTLGSSIGTNNDKVVAINVRMEQIQEPATIDLTLDSDDDANLEKNDKGPSDYSEGPKSSAKHIDPRIVPTRHFTNKSRSGRHMTGVSNTSSSDAIHPALRDSSQTARTTRLLASSRLGTESIQMTEATSPTPDIVLIPNLTITNSTPVPSEELPPSISPPNPTLASPDSIESFKESHRLSPPAGTQTPPLKLRRTSSSAQRKRHGQIFTPSRSSNELEDENEPLSTLHDRICRGRSLRDAQRATQEQEAASRDDPDAISQAPGPSFQAAMTSLERTPSLRLHPGQDREHGVGDTFSLGHIANMNTREAKGKENATCEIEDTGAGRMENGSREEQLGRTKKQHCQGQMDQEPQENPSPNPASPLSRLGKWLGGCMHFG